MTISSGTGSEPDRSESLSARRPTGCVENGLRSSAARYDPLVPPWTVRYEWKAGAYRYTTSGRFGHSLLAPLVSNVFDVLGMAVTLWHDDEWLPIHSVPPASSASRWSTAS